MKILHISKFYPPEPGGIESFVCDLAEAQVRQGHEVCVLAHQSEFNKPTCREQINGVKVRRIRTFGQAAYAPLTPGFPLHLLSSMRTFGPDVIHAHLPNISAFWLLFARKFCPLVLHWHADVVASPIDRKMGVLYNFYKPWELLLLKKADKIIATSNAYLNSSQPLTGFKKKTRVIPLGINPARLGESHSDGKAPT
ncbi:MAG: glycosyltransferase, partial [Desulfobacterales bacterium]